MAMLLRDWRNLRRRCHRALLARLRGDDAPQSQAAAGRAERAQPWLSGAYGAIIASKRRRELAEAVAIVAPSDPASSVAPVPVLSVGNFTFGATGKTPCALLLTELALRHAQQDRCRHRRARVPMLLTRGYGDDEWRQFAAKFPRCELAVGADRVRVGQQRACELGGRDALSGVVLDDGLQQWRIRKDLEVVMVDALHPFGNGLLLPHGSLREAPRDALARADVVIIHHADLLGSPDALAALKEELLSLVSERRPSAAVPTATATPTTATETEGATIGAADDAALPVLATSRMRVKRVVRALDMRDATSWDVGAEPANASDDNVYGDPDDIKVEATDREVARYEEFVGKVALVVCGVGNPESVQLVVERMGCWHEVHVEAFPDHHAFSSGDLDDMEQRIADLARTTQRDVVLLTTEKDFYRTEALLLEYHLATAASPPCDVRVLQCELELLENAQRVRDLVRTVLDCGAQQGRSQDQECRSAGVSRLGDAA